MIRAAGRFLAPAVLITALVLSPALGYATTFVLLGLGALATLWWLSNRPAGAAPSTASGGPPPPSSTGEDPGPRAPDAQTFQSTDDVRFLPRATGQGDQRSWWRGRHLHNAGTTTLFALAFALIALSVLLSGTDPTPLLGFTALLFYSPLGHVLADAPAPHRLALLGTAIGLATALLLHFVLDQPRAAEGFFLTDPYRLAVITLLLATLALGNLFTRDRLRWLTPLGLIAALLVIALTGSRTALIGLPVLLLITALCYLRRPPTIVAILAATAALILAALFVELPGTARTSLWSTLSNIAQGREVADVAVSLRLALYRLGLAHFSNSPLFGHGWSEANMAPIIAQLTPEQLSWGKLVHLHNDALQFAVSGGLLGLAAWLAILIAPLAGYLTLPPEAKGPAKLHATLVLVIGYFVVGLPDLMLGSPLQLTLYVTLTAVVLNTRPETLSS